MTLRTAVRHARDLGAVVEVRGRTGDLYFHHPLILRTVRTSVNNRDATRAVRLFLRRLERELFTERLRGAIMDLLSEQKETRA